MISLRPAGLYRRENGLIHSCFSYCDGLKDLCFSVHKWQNAHLHDMHWSFATDKENQSTRESKYFWHKKKSISDSFSSYQS